MELKVIQRKSVIASIIASVLVIYFIQPLLNILGQLFLTISNQLFAAYLDRLYAEIATGDINYSFVVVMYIRMLFIAISISGVLIMRYLLVRNKKTEKKKEDEGKKLNKAKAYFSIAFYLLFAFFILFGIVSDYVRLKTSATFKQHLTVLSPHISEQTEEQILAQFASMRDKQDYDNLIELLLNIAREKNVTLPENKLYPL